MTPVAARLVRNPTFWLWLPVLVVPPLLIVNAALQDRSVTVWGVLAGFAGCLPLLLRRRLGFFALAVPLTSGIVLVLWQLDPGDLVVLIPAVALGELASRHERRQVLWMTVAVVPCVAVSVVPFADDAGDFVSILLRNLAYCWMALAAGDAVRSRREALQRTAAAAEEAERLRIAQNVHDGIAHAMVAINVQAGVAAHLLDRDPEQARSALHAIKAASGEALADLRTTLGALRAAPLAPASGLGDLEPLAGGLRAAGVDVAIVADPAPVPAEVATAGYRIIQEALTNVLRHARAKRVDVRVIAGEGLRIEVFNDGPSRPATRGSGNGVRGMRERAEALGGRLDAGPQPDGGWRVVAELPPDGPPRGAMAVLRAGRPQGLP
jgi:signal transduction histidine kinase